MSDLDLTAAKALAYRVYCEAQHRGPMGDGDFEATRSRIEEAWMSTAVAAAAPLIAEQVRAQGQAALEQVASDRSYDSGESITEAYLDAARIVGGQS